MVLPWKEKVSLGSNDSKLGDGSSTGRYAPFSIQGDKLWKDVSLGKKSTCGITHDNKSYCWGNNSTYGELGNGTTTDSPIPVSTTGGHLFRQITSGEEIRCGVTTDDDLYCWGQNSEGTVGNNTDGTHQPTPQFVMGDVYQVDAGRRSNCAVKNDGKGFCWGFSFYNEELGLGYDSGEVDVPHAIYGNKTWLNTAPTDFEIYPYAARLELSWTAPTNAITWFFVILLLLQMSQ